MRMNVLFQVILRCNDYRLENLVFKLWIGVFKLMTSKLRDKIFNTKDIDSEKVFVKQWNVEIEVRGMTGKQRATVLQGSIGKDGKSIDFSKLYPDIVIATSYDPETGDAIFEATDRDMLNTKSSAATEKLAKTALKLSGLQEGNFEEIVKN